MIDDSNARGLSALLPLLKLRLRPRGECALFAAEAGEAAEAGHSRDRAFAGGLEFLHGFDLAERAHVGHLFRDR